MNPLQSSKENVLPGGLVQPIKSSPPLPPNEIPYADCIFRDGYIPKDEWEKSWVDWLNEKPWETDRYYLSLSLEARSEMVAIGIFLGTKDFKPDFLEKVQTLSDKFIYLLSALYIRASFTPLEWIPEHHLEQRLRKSVYPRLREIFDRHFGKKQHSGDELKQRMESAVREIYDISKECFTEEEIKEDFRGLLFHSGLEEISANDACVTNMAQNNLKEFQEIINNTLDDLGEIKRHFFEWNEENGKEGVKV